MSIGCLSTQNVDAEIKPKLISLNTRLCRQNRIVNLNEFYPYPTDNGTRQAAGELRAQVMTGSGAKQPHSTASCSDRIRSGKPTLADYAGIEPVHFGGAVSCKATKRNRRS
jgi:hypothetical protein